MNGRSRPGATCLLTSIGEAFLLALFCCRGGRAFDGFRAFGPAGLRAARASVYPGGCGVRGQGGVYAFPRVAAGGTPGGASHVSAAMSGVMIGTELMDCCGR